jgi:hypothetical protein
MHFSFVRIGQNGPVLHHNDPLNYLLRTGTLVVIIATCMSLTKRGRDIYHKQREIPRERERERERELCKQKWRTKRMPTELIVWS